MEDQTRIFGLRAILEAVNTGQEIEKVYLQKGLQGHLARQLEQLVRTNKIALSYVPVEKLNKLSRHQNHQGAVASISAISFQDLEETLTRIQKEKKSPLLLLLDQITDVRNLGAILRTAECTGVDAVVIPSHGSAPINADAIKTSAGAAFNIPICKVEQVLDALFLIQGMGIQAVAVTEKSKIPIYDIDLTGPTALIMGSEGKGISNKVLKQADAEGSLPILGSIESLNVSVACGAVLYETVRQRM
jgi:23S rRNA (guanosine2251-2'-O)-methyltransferase